MLQLNYIAMLNNLIHRCCINIKQKGAIDQNLLKFRALTRLTDSEIKKHLAELHCGECAAYHFYKSEARFPTSDESKLIAEYGIDLVLTSKRITIRFSKFEMLTTEEACKRMSAFGQIIKQTNK